MKSTFTFREIAEQWRKNKKPLVRKSTMCAYALIVKVHLIPTFGDYTRIAETEVQQFLIEKFISGLSRKTVKDIIAILKAIVRFGAKQGLCSFNGWEVVFPVETERKHLPILSLSDQRKLMRNLSENLTPQNIGILLSLNTGMRIGEVCALRWEDVDLSRHVINVRNSVGRIYDCEARETYKQFSSPKTVNSYREIPVSRLLRPALQAIRKLTPQAVYVVGGGQEPKEPRSYRDYFNRLLKRLDIPPIVFHGLRHTFATRCIESQCDYKTVSAILGHANVSTTLNLYVHPNFDQKRRCMERMNKLIGEL